MRGFWLRSILLSAILVMNAASESIAVSPVQNASPIQTFSPLVTGNGFGFAVVSTTGDVTRFYAHPYRYERPNPDLSKDGYDTANFIKSMCFAGFSGKSPAEVHYSSESQIISSKKNGVEQLFFMPFALKHNVLVCMLGKNSAEAALDIKWLHPVKHEEVKVLSGKQVRILTFTDLKERLAIVPLRASEQASSNSHLSGDAWALLSFERPDMLESAVKDIQKWHGGLDADALVKKEIAALEKWRAKAPVHFASQKEEALWRQNETLLKMAQIQEANTAERYSHGLILASLPDGVWFTPWVRDMTYALVGLVRMGHKDEAREGILSWFNARPVGLWKKEVRNCDYQISVVRYYGNGSEEADYSGQKTPNVEYDDWGLALWAIWQYWQQTHDDSLLSEKTYRGTVYDVMRDFIVKPLLANLDKYEDGLIVAEDSSCWEEHQENKRHYASSIIAAIPGLRGFQKIAESRHDDATAKLLSEKIQLLEQGFKKAYIRDGAICGVVEIDTQPKSEVDGAMLEAFNMDIVNDPAIFQKTVDKIKRLKTASGGYRRNLGPSDYEAHEFVLIDFNLARAFLKFGKRRDAQLLIETIVDKSVQDNGLIAEMYISEKNRGYSGEIGDPAGSIPMVGFGAGAYAMILQERENAR